MLMNILNKIWICLVLFVWVNISAFCFEHRKENNGSDKGNNNNMLGINILNCFLIGGHNGRREMRDKG